VNNELKTMMRLAPIENDQVSRELSASLGETATTFTGLPNFLRVLANAPAALKAYVLADAALGHGQTTPRERELIALLVAEINGCSYSLLAHCELAKNIGVVRALEENLGCKILVPEEPLLSGASGAALIGKDIVLKAMSAGEVVPRGERRFDDVKFFT